MELPIINIPTSMFLRHDGSTSVRSLSSTIDILEGALEHNVPISSYEDTFSILRHLRNYQILLDSLQYGERL